MLIGFFIMPPIFSLWGRERGVHIVSPLSVCTSVPSVFNKNDFHSISFEKISVLDSNFIHRNIIIKCRSSSI